jgi:pyruvate carboxylase
VNPRIQVEHTVTEQVTGIDIVKAQIRLLEGAVIGTPESGVPLQEDIRLNGNAIQCRVTTEDPEQNFIPDYGRITAYREATGFGVRLDGGTAYAGAVITRYYDPLLEKITCWAPSAPEGIARCASSASAAWQPTSRSLRTSSRIPISSRTATRRGSSTRRRHCSTSSGGRTGRPSS